MSVFGTIKTKWHLDEAVKAFLKDWLPTHLEEAARVMGYDPEQIARPRSYIRRNDRAITTWPGEQFPSVLILSPGMSEDKPRERGDGQIDVPYFIGVVGLVSATNEDTTAKLAAAYSAAVWLTFMQHRSLKSPSNPEGFAQDTVWEDESYDERRSTEDDRRTVAAAGNYFTIWVPGVVNTSQGTLEPLVEPEEDPGEWTTADTVQHTIERS